jgi:hypothetical protein
VQRTESHAINKVPRPVCDAETVLLARETTRPDANSLIIRSCPVTVLRSTAALDMCHETGLNDGPGVVSKFVASHPGPKMNGLCDEGCTFVLDYLSSVFTLNLVLVSRT